MREREPMVSSKGVAAESKGPQAELGTAKEWGGTVSKGPSVGAARLSRPGKLADGHASVGPPHRLASSGVRARPSSSSSSSRHGMAAVGSGNGRSRPQSRSSVRTAASTSASISSLFTPESRLKRSSLAVVSAASAKYPHQPTTPNSCAREDTCTTAMDLLHSKDDGMVCISMTETHCRLE